MAVGLGGALVILAGLAPSGLAPADVALLVFFGASLLVSVWGTVSRLLALAAAVGCLLTIGSPTPLQFRVAILSLSLGMTAPRLPAWTAIGGGLTHLGTAVVLLALGGYALGFYPYYGRSSEKTLSLAALMLLFLACAGAWSLRAPDLALMLRESRAAALTVRWLLPIPFVYPFVFGALNQLAVRQGWYAAMTGIWLFALANTVFFAVLIAWTASRLHRLDRERTAAQEATAAANAALEARVADRTAALHNEIQEKQRVLEGLRESNERFTRFMQHLPGAAWIKDLQGRYVYANPEAAVVFGKPLESILGRTDEEIFPAGTAAQFRANDELALRQGSLRILELLERPDGIHESVVSKFAISDETNAPVLVGGVAIDVTERARAEEARRESQERLHLAANAARIGTWSWELDTNAVQWSPELYELVGRTPESLPAAIESWNAIMHPEDRDAAWQRAAEALPHATGFESEFRIVLPGGALRWMLARATIVRRLDDSPVRIIGVLIDVTERREAELLLRESEEQMRAIIDTALDAVISIDENSIVTEWNPQAGVIFGYEPQEMLGKPLDLLMPPEERAAHHAGMQRYLTTGQARLIGRRIELVGLRKSGAAFPIELTIARTSVGGKVRFSAFVRDISESKRAEQELRSANEDLRRANRDLEQFAYSAAHDLQEPLRMVGLYTDLLRKSLEGKLAPPSDTYMSFAIQGAARAQQLIADLLAYTHAAAPGDTPASASAEAALQHALENLAESIAQTGANISHSPLPTVAVHTPHLEQLLQNLLGNAIKYRAGRPLQIHIAAEREGAFSLFSVADNGMGIDPRYKEQIFGLFKRLHTVNSYPGTGIGLAICQRLVERYGGRIWVESALGEGSTFYFTLPNPVPDNR